MRYTELYEYDRSKTAQAVGANLLAAAWKDRWLVDQLTGGNRMGATFQDIAKKEPAKLVDAILEIIEQADPTRNKQFTQWMARTYAKGNFKAEDLAGQVSPLLQNFAACAVKKSIKAQYPIAWDINQYKDFNSFMDAASSLPDPNAVPDAEVKPEDAGEYKQLTPPGSDVLVVQLIDEKSAGYFGRKKMPNETRWCTRHYGESGNMFNHYNRQGPMYVIVPAVPAHTGERYQFHPASKQYMDENDRPIGMEGVAKLVKRYPVLLKALQEPGERYAILPLIGPEYKNIVKEFTPEAIKATYALVQQYKPRIVAFGLKNLAEYGIQVSNQDQQVLGQQAGALIDDLMQNMDSIWAQIVKNPGMERSGDRVEAALSSDDGLKQISANSEAAQTLKDIVEQSSKRLHKDTVPHIVDIALRDPLFRIMMVKVPQMYTAKLQEHGHALS